MNLSFGNALVDETCYQVPNSYSNLLPISELLFVKDGRRQIRLFHKHGYRIKLDQPVADIIESHSPVATVFDTVSGPTESSHLSCTDPSDSVRLLTAQDALYLDICYQSGILKGAAFSTLSRGIAFKLNYDITLVMNEHLLVESHYLGFSSHTNPLLDVAFDAYSSVITIAGSTEGKKQYGYIVMSGAHLTVEMTAMSHFAKKASSFAYLAGIPLVHVKLWHLGPEVTDMTQALPLSCRDGLDMITAKFSFDNGVLAAKLDACPKSGLETGKLLAQSDIRLVFSLAKSEAKVDLFQIDNLFQIGHPVFSSPELHPVSPPSTGTAPIEPVSESLTASGKRKRSDDDLSKRMLPRVPGFFDSPTKLPHFLPDIENLPCSVCNGVMSGTKKVGCISKCRHLCHPECLGNGDECVRCIDEMIATTLLD